MMMFLVRTLSALMKVSSKGKSTILAWRLMLVMCFCVSSDMIYEDVQKDSGPLDADNGWSSSEFESYEEQSDSEAKPATRSKVQLARCFRFHGSYARLVVYCADVII